MHGKQDRAVPFERSMQMAEAITQCNPFHRLYFDEHETFGHGEYARAFNKPELYEWLFQHRKNDSSLYILADHYIDIYPKAFSTHYTVPNEPGLYREAQEESSIPLEDSIVQQEEMLAIDLPEKQVPKASKPKSAPNKKSVYVVKSGDNLSVISKKTGVPLSKLKALNGNGKLKPGQKIRLK
jgi:LysM repeat protein